MRILGVDPGSQGALALYQPHKTPASGLRWMILDMPSTRQFRDWLRRYEPTICYFEDTFHIKQSAVNSYTFGKVVGKQIGVLECCDVPIEYIPPMTWKTHYKLIKKPKTASLTLARKLVDDEIAQLSLQRQMDHNRAEAVLIALYGAHRHGELL